MYDRHSKTEQLNIPIFQPKTHTSSGKFHSELTWNVVTSLLHTEESIFNAEHSDESEEINAPQNIDNNESVAKGNEDLDIEANSKEVKQHPVSNQGIFLKSPSTDSLEDFQFNLDM